MIGGKQPNAMHFWRENAQAVPANVGGVARPFSACKPVRAVGFLSIVSTAHCQYRYPSPSRFAPPRSRPATFFRRDLFGFARRTQIYVDIARQTADFARHRKTHKGSSQWLNSVSSSSRPRSFPFPRVSTPTPSVALPVPQPVLSSLTQLAATSSTVSLSVALLACSATTWAPASSKTFRPSGRLTNLNRRWCPHAPAAVLHSKDRFPCSKRS
ncbi:MAG: hypothetical protein ACI86S_001076 [Paracoccaceae bacterium]|jgi:hypothetical protein